MVNATAKLAAVEAAAVAATADEVVAEEVVAIEAVAMQAPVEAAAMDAAADRLRQHLCTTGRALQHTQTCQQSQTTNANYNKVIRRGSIAGRSSPRTA